MKKVIVDCINHNFARMGIDSYNSLLLKRYWFFDNVIMLIKSVVYKSKNEYYYNIYLEKGSYQAKSNTEYF